MPLYRFFSVDAYRFVVSRRVPGLFGLFGLAAVVGVTSPQAAQDAGDPTVPSEVMTELMREGAAQQPGQSAATASRIDLQMDGDIFREVRIFEAPLAEVAGEIGAAARANVLVSADVADQEITVRLGDLDLNGLLDAIGFSQNLIVQRDRDTGVYALRSAQSVEQGVVSLRDDQTKVYTLLYPNAPDVARAIGNLFGDRVIVTLDEPSDDARLELEERFDRFELLDEQSTDIRGTGGGSGSRSSSSDRSSRISSSDRGRGSGGSSAGGSRIGGQRFTLNQVEREEEFLLDADQLRAASAAETAQERIELREALAQRKAVTFVTVVRRLNRIVVRSADQRMIDTIEELIRELDVPTPLVLLETKVLRIDLGDDVSSAFDFGFQFGDARFGDFQGGFTRGEIANGAPGSALLGGGGFNAEAGLFQVVADQFSARLELLQAKGKVTALATPVLLTANNEVSRIFSGEEIPVLRGFNASQVVVSDGGITTFPPDPDFQVEDVGTSLLITASINADRTVTLSLIQETSSINPGGATLLVPNGATLTEEVVDTVLTQSASGTIIAADGQLLAFGGLIEESVSDQRVQWPILGDLPLIGGLFRREEAVRSRSELVVVIRPYILNTPVEGDRISRELLEDLSMHPQVEDSYDSDLGVFRDTEPLGPDARHELIEAFRFHHESGGEEALP
ncbi:MAG: hypothetical protein AAGH99_09305 [Planctomycetota bacterium]